MLNGKEALPVVRVGPLPLGGFLDLTDDLAQVGVSPDSSRGPMTRSLSHETIAKVPEDGSPSPQLVVSHLPSADASNPVQDMRPLGYSST